MKIIYKENPLMSEIQMTPQEKEQFRLRVKIELLKDIIYGANFTLQKVGKSSEEQISLALKYLNTEYICDGKLDARVGELTKHYLDEAVSIHIGDCTCVACSCGKCQLESLIGVDTIPGLGKYAANKINGAFSYNDNGVWKQRTIDEALERLANYVTPVKTDAWKQFSQDQFDSYIPKWRADQMLAYEWLKGYRETKLRQP